MKDRPATPEQQKIADRMRDKMATLFKEELSWEKLEPVYYRVYRDTFTQEEIDGMLAFYKTPAGQSMIHKMPVVMQRTMTEMQMQMKPMMQKMQTLVEESVKEAEAAQSR